MSERNLTDADVLAIVEKLNGHKCRFDKVSLEDMDDFREAAKFYKHFNEIMSETGSTVRKTIVVIGVGGLVTVIGLGVIYKVKQVLGV